MGITFYARLRKRSMKFQRWIITNYEIEVPAKIVKEYGLQIGEILKVEIERTGVVLPGKGLRKLAEVIENIG